MSVDRFLDYITHEKKYSPHTCNAYKKNLTDFNDFCASHFELESIDYVTIVISELGLSAWLKVKIPIELLIVKFQFSDPTINSCSERKQSLYHRLSYIDRSRFPKGKYTLLN